jgi:phenylpyruvate tautomerase PptA (4-oxalocrotonate tautomerase family)
MPMIDAYVPHGALAPEDEHALLRTLTDLVLRWEGADPGDPVARSIAWAFLHRPDSVLVAGASPDAPRYKVVISVPQGQLDDERRSGMVAAVTEAVLDAEAGAHPRDPFRIWVFPQEVPDGTWGGGGRIFRLADIAGLVLGDAEAGRAHAEQRLGPPPAQPESATQPESAR